MIDWTFGCFLALLMIQINIISVNGKLDDIREILRQIRNKEK